MGYRRAAIRRGTAGSLVAGVVLFAAVVAFAQDASKPQQPPTEQPGLLGRAGRWIEEQVEKFGSHVRGAGSGIENLSHEAGRAAQSTVEDAKDAATAVTKIPAMRTVTGHEQCNTALNGAPDCVAAAIAICKNNGFASGKSVDMTATETCPPQVYAAGRNSGPDCHTETFVSRALCQ